MKKLFHRKKISAPDSPEQTPSRSRQTEDLSADPGLRTSRYESTTPADLPQSGQFPLKSNNSSVSFQGRHPDTYSRGQAIGGVEPTPRPSSSSPYYGSLPAPRVTSVSYNLAAPCYPPVGGRSDPEAVNNNQQRQRYVPTDGPPTHEFSKLDLDSTADQLDQQDSPLRYHHGHRVSALHTQDAAYPATRQGRQPYGAESASGIRIVGQRQPVQQDDHVPRQTSNSGLRDQGTLDVRDQSYGRPGTQSSSNAFSRLPEDKATMRRKNSIPRKKIPNTAQTPAVTNEPATSLPLPTDQSYDIRHSSVPTNRFEEDFHPGQQAPAGSQRFAQDSYPSAQQVVDRARDDTYDTEVVEKIAPAVVHERVHKDIHHVREEVITKEIHNHDVYHRILPIIDVEVLPPRHFLPVEGGGLVEISGKEVPGRGNNWVIAETASKIPSDQPAPRGSRTFSARQFPGVEGDAVEYNTPEGYRKTEQTWVYPPELETGGRNSGQTWPMEFGGEMTPKAGREHQTSKPSKAGMLRNL